ncbi:hypothetical protein [Saccharibacter floricola]|uniref:Uncharacterized protein n=1 Tax=Saccharibacter floricola DSM 15669 TaxID=1123227 RepID=A0ABQ0P0R9_9PROT|nr:hypothetical protein [Saccharibacter floricola]GBQ08446.1 hypothetical protein AA15669_1787 [Saccharibacter floricola DSM 15669]
MTLAVRKKTPKGTPFPRPNAGIAEAYRRSMHRAIALMGRDYVREIRQLYQQNGLGLVGDEAPNQPRDEHGRWVAQGGASFVGLQKTYAALLDRLEAEGKQRGPYGVAAWNMGPGGHDTRQEAELNRPVVLGEIPHPDISHARIPIIFSEGRQKTTHPSGKGWGRRHIEFRHGRQIRELGFKHALEFAHYIVTHHTQDIESPRHRSRNLVITKESVEHMIEALHLTPVGDHYRVTTAYPTEEKMGTIR